MIQNALDLRSSMDAVDALQILEEHGICLDAQQVLTRADAAQVIYQVSALAPEAPGTAVLRIVG